ncbi:Alkylmercury lyase [Amycolatopsis arida]|uniref:Alkylmercury lyase n=1 Tax=Amycolatopsis arida TaxID=587909 RepID=A0A1I5MAR5_9PSEU|nr:alkylmercury lyase family protein [Amycolatopsis arida]TDX94015.1 alkylmercury lyase-like protein [Amycolatopsis arida]SFP06101.1 Alkylmercury lyase [Amycolatopsis arida]
MTELPDLGLNKSEAAAALTPAARRLHRLALTAFAEAGRAPRRADLERDARDHGIDPGPALAELTERDVLAVDERGEIRAAYPFSPVPTRHHVSWDGAASTVYAMCAIDALGVSAMLGIPITISSTEPDTDRTVTVHVDQRTARWRPDTAVVFAGATEDTCCPSVDRTCGYINFFTSPDAVRRWTARNPGVTGVVLDQDQALASAVAEFGALLRREGQR